MFSTTISWKLSQKQEAKNLLREDSSRARVSRLKWLLQMLSLSATSPMKATWRRSTCSFLRQMSSTILLLSKRPDGYGRWENWLLWTKKEIPRQEGNSHFDKTDWGLGLSCCYKEDSRNPWPGRGLLLRRSLLIREQSRSFAQPPEPRLICSMPYTVPCAQSWG